MAYDPQEGRFALFANEHKEHVKQPDFTGRFRLHGKLFLLVAWSRETRTGDPYVGGEIVELSDEDGFPV